MKTLRRVSVRLGARHSYEIKIGANALDQAGRIARASLSTHAHRLVIISNRRVFDLYGAPVVASLRASGFAVSSWLMSDGERFKSLRTAERAMSFLSESKLERSDAVIALGGGVVGDLAGFVAAVYLRGIDFMQVPTTLLAQIDSSVGGKTAVNMRAGKNLIGVFHQPRAVVIDPATLRTLPRRELTAGWCEALKQGAVGGRPLFEQTRRCLMDEHSRGKTKIKEAQNVARGERLAALIARQCAFKAKIVAHDERESVARTDHLSRRVLNYGHTTAHALETVTSYRRFRHGEAVGYGMLVAGEMAKKLGLLDASELELLGDGIRLAGRLPRADDLDLSAIIRALASDKKALGGEVQWVLLERIGRARILSGREIPPHLVRASLRAVLHTHS